GETLRKGKACYEIRVEIDSAEPSKWLRAELVLNHVRATGQILRVYPPRDAFMKDGFGGRFLLWVAAEVTAAELRNRVSVDLLKRLDIVPLRKSAREAEPAVPDKPLSEPSAKRDGTATGSASSVSSFLNTVRVPVHKLDSLLHLIGELVIANSGMKLLENRLREKYHDDLIKGDMSLLNDQLMKITLGLQTDVLNMRMLPIGTVFGAFHRIVRDLSKQEGRNVNLVVSGMDTELDKKIIDAIGEPLMHLVRNAVDHGIEPPDERSRSGKSATGTITLSASQSGNRILVSVRDDGRGVDPAVIRRRAAETGLVTREQAAGMSDDEALEFIFRHGFSTSEPVSYTHLRAHESA
ncbi:MAG: ATP-binding protein, partial [bacterium]|nr:ATP-binding protein [bacterium]